MQRFGLINVLQQAPSSSFARCENGHTRRLAMNELFPSLSWPRQKILSERDWTANGERTVLTVMMHYRINADYIRMADQYLEVPAGSNNNVRQSLRNLEKS